MGSVWGTRFLCDLVAGAVLAAGACGTAAQQTYPSRAVRLIVPLSPGGTTDIMARTMAQQLAGSLGQQVIVENRAGAGGTVGSDYVAKSAPDGYTRLPFDARKDLKPLSVLAASPSILTVHPSLPVKTVKELITLSKARPNDLNYGSGGTSGQLRMELLKFNTGMHITNIPYKGSGPALIDQIAGHVHVGFFNLVATAPYVVAGKLRGIVVTGSKRSNTLPAVPSTKESGVKGFDENVGYLMLAPSATPKEIVSRLNTDIVKVLRGPEVSSRLAAEGSEVVGSTPEEATVVINRQLDQWADIVRRTGIKLQ
jgi:tripartite-type tricarboxylate transporter receptor subunit TctC